MLFLFTNAKENGMFTAGRILFCVTLFSLTASAMAQQMPILSKACPVGTTEAQGLFLTGMQIRSGKEDEKKNPQLAEEYFEMAIVKGSAQAAIALGDMYRYDFAKKHPKAVCEKQSKAMYTLATELGCPDAYAFLAEYHSKGIGVKKDPEKALELAKQAADADSPKGMEVYGRLLAEVKKDVDSGRIWLKRAIETGNGDAGLSLADTYARERDIGGVLVSLRSGAAQGSRQCLQVLTAIFADGHYGQDKDAMHASCYRKLEKSIDEYATPQPIANLEKQCPMKKFFMPFKNR